MTTPTDRYRGYDVTLESPPFDFEPADYATSDYEFAQPTRGLRVLANVAGSLVVRPIGSDTDRTLPYLPGLWWEPGRFTHIRHTGSTAGYTVHGLA